MNLEQRLVEKFGPSSVSLIPKMKETAGSEELAANVVSCMIPDDVPSVISFKTIRGENATSLTSGDDLADSNSFFFDDKRVVTFGAKAYFTSLPLIYSSYEDDLFSLFISRSDVCVRFDTDGRYVRVDGDDRFMDTAITTQGKRLAMFENAKAYYHQLANKLRKVFPKFDIEDEVEILFRDGHFIFIPTRVPKIYTPSPSHAFAHYIEQLERMPDEQLKAIVQHNHLVAKTRTQSITEIVNNLNCKIGSDEINRLALEFIQTHPGADLFEISNYIESHPLVKKWIVPHEVRIYKNRQEVNIYRLIDLVDRGEILEKVDNDIKDIGKYKYYPM